MLGRSLGMRLTYAISIQKFTATYSGGHWSSNIHQNSKTCEMCTGTPNHSIVRWHVIPCTHMCSEGRERVEWLLCLSVCAFVDCGHTNEQFEQLGMLVIFSCKVHIHHKWKISKLVHILQTRVIRRAMKSKLFRSLSKLSNTTTPWSQYSCLCWAQWCHHTSTLNLSAKRGTEQVLYWALLVLYKCSTQVLLFDP